MKIDINQPRKNFWQSSLGVAILGPLLSAAIGIPTLWYTYKTNIYTQDRQRVIEQVRSLDDANSKLLEAGASFIVAINSAGDINGAREKLSTLLAQQAIGASSYQSILKNKDVSYAKEYIDALKELNSVSRNVSEPTDMRAWVEAFGRVLDTRSRLVQVINLGVKNNA